MSTVDGCRVSMHTTTDGFYSPLLGQRDIRLLEVLPGDDASIVVTTMITVSLDSEPTYAALSYAWGDATQRSIIECNGKSISITTSLAEALKAFRSFSAGPDAPLREVQNIIWADQLCINQHDILERNHQVGMMGSVYSSCACAFIWLGPGDEDSDRALSFVDFLHELYLEYVVRKDDLGSYDDVDVLELDNAISRSDDQAWAKLEALCLRPWFRRSWTFQESVRAPDRMVACGSQIRTWDTFLKASLTCCLKTSSKVASQSVFPILRILSAINDKSEGLHLSSLLSSSWLTDASDPRDKVYALYGLVQDYQKVPLEINYAMSVEDVYRSTVRFCIENEGKLSVLGYVAKFRNQSDMPSWVPDWRDQSYSGCVPVGGHWNQEFNASSMSRPLLVPSSSSDKLILNGFIVAMVERTINIAALRVNPADSSPDSWRTNAAAAGVPVRFLQGEKYQTSYDLTATIERSPFHGQTVARGHWPNSARWFAAGRRDPMPQAVLTDYGAAFDTGTFNKCVFLTTDSLGLAPEPTQVGDVICILLGGDTPFILRPRQNTARNTPSNEAKPKRQSALKTTPQGITKARSQGSRKSARRAKQVFETTTEWTLIGDCYLYGYMRGEAMEMVTEADYMNFTLV